MIKKIQRVSGAIEFFTDENISLQAIVDVNMLTDGTILRLANTHASSTITCTLPTGQTMNGQSSFTIAPDTLLEFELIGSAWKCVSNEWEKIAVYTGTGGGGNINQFRRLRLEFLTSQHVIQNTVEAQISSLTAISGQRRLLYSAYFQNTDNTVYQGAGYLAIDDSGNVVSNSLYKFTNLLLYKIILYGMK